jgi:RecA-family ATPase
MIKKSIGAPAPKAFFRKNAFGLDPIDKESKFSNELVEGLFTSPSVAMLYGASNSGKTFYGIDISMSVSLGIETLGMRTSKAAVLYLAAESPEGVEVRMRTWLEGNRNRFTSVGVCEIVGKDIDLFSESSTESIELTIDEINKENRLQDGSTNDVGLVVVDTLAKASGRADENGSDMKTVMRHAERIAKNKNCVVLIIHHSGKDKSAGARGHSSVGGAVDTVINIGQAQGKSLCIIEKQRDLPTKGKEFAFSLESVDIGINQWGTKRTSCFVQACEVPKTVNGLSANDRKIVAALRSAGIGMKRPELADAAGLDIANSNARVRILLKSGVLFESDTGSKVFLKLDDDEVA